MAPATGTRLPTRVAKLLMQEAACYRDDQRVSTIEWSGSVGMRVAEGLVDEAIARRSLYLIVICTGSLGIGDGIANAFRVSNYDLRR